MMYTGGSGTIQIINNKNNNVVLLYYISFQYVVFEKTEVKGAIKS